MGKKIYILGCNRSGTTLLLNLFRCGQSMLILNGEMPPPAMYYAEDIYEGDWNIVAKRNGGGANFGTTVSGVDPFGLRKNLIHQLKTGTSLKEYLEESQNYFAPNWVRWLADWQNVYYVFIRRDPRDVITSKMFEQKYVSNLHMWREAEATYEEFQKINPDKTILVNYENLVQNPEETMGDVFDKIGLTKAYSFENWVDLLQDKDKAHKSMRWMHGPRKVDSSSIGKWKTKEGGVERIKMVIEQNPNFVQLIVDYGYDVEGWENDL